MYVKYFFDRTDNKYEDYLNEGVTNEEYFLLKNISIESYAYVVNEHGIVRIGNTLYQFTRSWTKSIEPAAPGKVNTLINATPNSSNELGEVLFRAPGRIPNISKLTSCDLPSYYYDNAWGTQGTTEFSSSPKLKLYIYGGYRFTNDYYCRATYSPFVEVYADSYKKSWYNVQWLQVNSEKTLQVSYLVNNPDGTTSNEYSFATDPNDWRVHYTKSFPSINSQTYSKMFIITNFYARATMNGGSSGGAISITH
jgi:hypothetical protein